METNLFL